MQGLDSWETDEGMNCTKGLCFCFDQSSSAKCETPLPSAYWDEPCVSLLASYIFCESRNSLEVLFTYMHACVCVHLWLSWSKQKRKKYLLYSCTQLFHRMYSASMKSPPFWNCSQNNQNLVIEKEMWVVTIMWIKGRRGMLLRSLSKVLWDDKLPSLLWAENREGNGVTENWVFSIAREDVKLINFNWE